MSAPSFWNAVCVPVMEKKGWNQRQLSDNARVAKSVVTFWRNGGLPEDLTLQTFKEFCELDTDYWIVQRELQSMRRKLSRKNIDVDKYLNPN